MTIDVGAQSHPKYSSMQAALVLALYDPAWPVSGQKIAGLGRLHVNPARIVFVQPSLNLRLIRKQDSIFATGDLWAAWTTLPPIPPQLVGTVLAMQILCWEKVGSPQYSLSWGAYTLTVVPA